MIDLVAAGAGFAWWGVPGDQFPARAGSLSGVGNCSRCIRGCSKALGQLAAVLDGRLEAAVQKQLPYAHLLVDWLSTETAVIACSITATS